MGSPLGIVDVITESQYIFMELIYILEHAFHRNAVASLRKNTPGHAGFFFLIQVSTKPIIPSAHINRYSPAPLFVCLQNEWSVSDSDKQSHEDGIFTSSSEIWFFQKSPGPAGN